MLRNCELCDGVVIKVNNDYICQKCGTLFAETYIKKLKSSESIMNDEEFSLSKQKYVSPNYDSFQKRIILKYSYSGSGIEALQEWKRTHQYNPNCDQEEIYERDNLIKVAEMEKELNPWMDMEPIARCEEEALLFGNVYAEAYHNSRMNEKTIITALKNGKIHINSYFAKEEINSNELKCKHYLLISAIAKSHNELVNYMLEHNCDIDIESMVTVKGKKVFDSPLSAAIANKNTCIIDALVKRGYDIHKKVKIGIVELNMLSFAVSESTLEIVNQLLKLGLDVNEQSFSNYWSVPLYDALIFERYDIAKTLIDAGADVDFVLRTNEADYTMLNWAIINGNMQAFNLLISAKANPNCIRVSHIGYGKTPALFDAVWLRRFEMVKRLVFAGADVNCYQEGDDGKRFTLVEKARKNCDTEILHFLISHGAK